MIKIVSLPRLSHAFFFDAIKQPITSLLFPSIQWELLLLSRSSGRYREGSSRYFDRSRTRLPTPDFPRLPTCLPICICFFSIQWRNYITRMLLFSIHLLITKLDQSGGRYNDGWRVFTIFWSWPGASPNSCAFQHVFLCVVPKKRAKFNFHLIILLIILRGEVRCTSHIWGKRGDFGGHVSLHAGQ